MSYYVADVNGYVGDLATVAGLKALREHVETGGDRKVKAFFTKGYGVAKDILPSLEAMTEPEDEAVSVTLANLVVLARKCDEVIIITDGVTEEDADAED